VRGLLHAVWHFPLIFLTTAYLIHANRMLTVPLFMVTLTCAGFAYAYFRFSTGSVWPGTLAHATFNIGSAAFDGLTDQSNPGAMAYLVREGGILIALGAIVLAVWAVWRMQAYSLLLRSPDADGAAHNFKASAVE
jgi:membrane protease YdiL (CAAX protease family)